jgi:hypothetical protein
MRKLSMIAIAMVIVVMATLTARTAAAAEMTWTMTSNYEYQVSVAFYSQDRDHVWPGGDDSYVLKDSRAHSFTLSCHRGEKICYGAWPTGGRSTTYWGVGRNNRQHCSNCCYTCGEANPERTLNN